MYRTPAHGNAAPRPDRANLYDEITAKIISDLEGGCFPWVQPWEASGVPAPLSMPRNAATGRAYSGINVLILWGTVVARGFSAQSWLTFKQALALGGCVRKGERGITVVYADRFVPEGEKRRARDTGEEAHAIPPRAPVQLAICGNLLSVQTDDGERVIGRRVAPHWIADALGSEAPTIAPDNAWRSILDRGDSLQLEGGLGLRRSRVMNVERVELTGYTDGMVERLKALGLMSEIISWRLRLFVPTSANGPNILAGLLDRHPIQRVIDRAAA